MEVNVNGNSNDRRYVAVSTSKPLFGNILQISNLLVTKSSRKPGQSALNFGQNANFALDLVMNAID